MTGELSEAALGAPVLRFYGKVRADARLGLFFRPESEDPDAKRQTAKCGG
ncbi:hypothetical protein [Phenylobacterium sp.]|nr:hypothetical protein [Phenylobacterium sp.]MDP3852434.1 hypothetical protein [Phenylobacterium sp.]